MNCPTRKQSGFAMILVIWALVLLTSMATGFALTVRHEARVAADVENATYAEAAVVAGIHLAVLALNHSDPELRWIPDNAEREIEWRDIQIRIRPQYESGRIDINRGSRELLIGLFEQLYISQDPEALADALMDWRDRDDEPRDQGAEADAYASAGYAYGPANMPFQSVHELGQVIGFDGEMLDAARPYLTVHSKQSRIHAASADLVVLTAIPGVDEADAAAFISQREQVSADEGEIDYDILQAGSKYLNKNAGQKMFALDIDVTLGNGYQRREHAVFELDARQGFHLISRELRAVSAEDVKASR